MNSLQQLEHRLELENKARIARENFYEFRLMMHPEMKEGWWQREVADDLQLFFEKLISGQRPYLVIEAPPQHGKSIQIIDFIAWVAGKRPDLATIYTSFSERLGLRANLRMQRYLDSPTYRAIFPETYLNRLNQTPKGLQRHIRNNDMLEFVGQAGSFRNTTIMGSITGEGLDLGVIDDPLKGREAAESETIRNKTWDWLTDDFMTRFSEHSGLLIILTRWHLDDPVGRIKKTLPDVKCKRYPAIAEFDEPHRKRGEPLFPEHKSLEFLMSRKKLMVPSSWESLYQQNPIPREGGVIKAQWLETRFKCELTVEALTARDPVMVVQSIDCASKPQERNDPTSCITFGVFKDHVEIWEVWAERMEFPDAQRKVKDSASKWNPKALIIEDKDMGQQLIQQLRRDTRLPIIASNPGTLDKITRMDSETPFIEAGKLWLPENAPWLFDFITELITFPSAAHDDSVDALSQGLKWINAKRISRLPPMPDGEEEMSRHNLLQ